MVVTTTNSVGEPQNAPSHDADKNIFPDERRTNNDPRNDPRASKQQRQPRRDRRDVHGWVILDKPIGMTSTQAVAVVKRLFNAKRAGHAGTLDPLASGGLPIALGEATKTVPFVMDGRKRYRFTVCWGEERDTDDTEGRVVKTSDLRPTAEAISALLPRFTGLVEQVPPQFSAVKVDGERAYDIARSGESVELAPRTVTVATPPTTSLALVSSERPRLSKKVTSVRSPVAAPGSRISVSIRERVNGEAEPSV